MHSLDMRAIVGDQASEGKLPGLRRLQQRQGQPRFARPRGAADQHRLGADQHRGSVNGVALFRHGDRFCLSPDKSDLSDFALNSADLG
jgi:hypothetical protein